MLKLYRIGCLAALAMVFVVGCDSPDAQTKATGGAATSTGSEPKPATPVANAVPESLKSDAYHYYGLERKDPANLTITVKGGAGPVTGTQHAEFIGMENGKARFRIVRTGELEQLGNEDVLLGPEGIVAESVSPGKLEGHPIELPASLKPGSTWKTDYKVTQPDGTVQEDHSTFKVVGEQKVTTPAGTFDAILIESTGNDVLNGVKTKLQTRSWYVKGRGAVKTVFTTTPNNGPSTVMTLEETPAASTTS